jgi:ABC-2 type transport system permease protein
MNRVWDQCQKELNQFQRDRLGVALAFILPLAALLIIGFAIRLEAKNIPLAVQDLDRTSLSRGYIERLYATNQFTPVPWKGSTFPDAIDRGQATVQVTIPPGFARDILSQRGMQVQAVVDGGDVVNARVVKLSLDGVGQSFLESVTDIGQTSLGVIAQVRLWFNPGRAESLFIVPGAYGVILALFPPLLIAIALVREKEQGTILQLYATSMSAVELLLGKTLAYLAIGIGEAVLLMGIGYLLFGVGFVGDPTPLLVGTPIFLMAGVQLGLIIAIFTNTQSSAVQGIGTVKVLTAFLLAGFLFPLNTVPFPFSLVSYLVPVRYYIELCRDAFVRGAGWMGTGHLIAIMALLGAVEFWVAWLGMRRMQLQD